MAFPPTLEQWDAERADFARVLAAIRSIQSAAPETLLRLDWLEETICSVGLGILTPPEVIYADKGDLVNGSHQGVTQYPIEFARWLRLLADERPSSYLEIGCYNGGTACLAAAYLQRFHPEFRALTIDLHPWFLFHAEAARLIPLDYEVGVTSYHLRGRVFDAVFIDGNHDFEWMWADYQNAGRSARICGIHDVNNAFIFENFSLGGSTACWRWLKETEGGADIEFLEFFDHPDDNIFGIGVRRKRTGRSPGS